MPDANRSFMRWLRRHPIACYLAVTFAVTWGAWIPLAVTGRAVTIGFTPVYLLGLIGPAIGAVVTTAIVGGTEGLRGLSARILRIRTGARWWSIGPGIVLGVGLVVGAGALVIATFGIAGLHPWADFGAFNGFPLADPLVLWLLLIVINGFGEETGWRGYLLPHLQRRWSPLVSSLVVGVVWSAWHIPAFFITETYRQMPLAFIPLFVVSLTCGSVVLTWLYNRGRSSILLVAVWHGTYNWLSGSVGARGALAAIETTVVMVLAAILVVQELVAIRRDRRGQPARHALTPTSLGIPHPVW
jgi:membrane protease YdiL (CAAX protease family)